MIPNISNIVDEITDPVYPNKTYKIKITQDDSDRISGYVDGLEAVKQTIYLILSTERYRHVIYSWDYGVELLNLFGKPIPYVIAELPRRIKDALTQDNRIYDVIDFTFTKKRNKLSTTFTVLTNFGDISTELEVDI